MVKNKKGLTYGFLILKTVTFIAAGISILIMYKNTLNALHFVVGGTMMLYALLGVAEYAVLKSESKANVFEYLIYVVIGVTMIIVAKDDLENICLIWAMWSIMRESNDLGESLTELKKKRYI